MADPGIPKEWLMRTGSKPLRQYLPHGENRYWIDVRPAPRRESEELEHMLLVGVPHGDVNEFLLRHSLVGFHLPADGQDVAHNPEDVEFRMKQLQELGGRLKAWVYSHLWATNGYLKQARLCELDSQDRRLSAEETERLGEMELAAQEAFLGNLLTSPEPTGEETTSGTER